MTETLKITPMLPYDEIQCPWCGHPENLPTDLEGIWTCEVCGQDFWITPMRLIATSEPKVIKAANGDILAVQLPLWVLSMDITNYGKTASNNDSHS